MSTHTHTHIPFSSDGYFSTLLLLLLLLCVLCSIPFIPLERRLKLKRNVLQATIIWTEIYFGPLAATIICILLFFLGKEFPSFTSFVGLLSIFFFLSFFWLFFHLFLFNLQWMSSASTPSIFPSTCHLTTRGTASAERWLTARRITTGGGQREIRVEELYTAEREGNGEPKKMRGSS